jgi:ribosomal protein L11 methyltransferase
MENSINQESYNEIHITTSADEVLSVSEQLTELGAVAVTCTDHGDAPIFEPTSNTPRIWPETKIIGLFTKDADLTPVIHYLEETKRPFTQKNIPPKDWIRASLDQFQPMSFGKKLWVVPSWVEAPDADAINITLDPGLAFGTGTHATTALCLEWLAQHIQNEALVVDYGTGSGILGIAALKLGAQKVIAIDHDPVALQTSRDNATKNGITNDQWVTDYPANLPDVEADLIIANILATPLIELAPLFAKSTKKQGIIILSGILRHDVQKICDIYQSWYTMQHPVYQEDWALLIGIRTKQQLIEQRPIVYNTDLKEL